MIPSLDIILIVIFTLVQWRITKLWLRWAGRRESRALRTAARLAVFLADALIFAAYGLNSSTILARWPVVSGRTAMLAGAVSLAYLLGATVVLAIYEILAAIQKHFGARLDPGRRRALRTAGHALLAAPFVAMGYGAFVERLDFQVREVDVPLPGLPRDLDGLRVLQLSDIHLGAFLSERDLARVVDAAISLRPHLAVVTGDLISSHGDPLDVCIRQLARLKSDAGIFGCLGNHEHYADAEDRTEAAGARAGIGFLRGRAQQLRFGSAVLNLAGMDHQSMFRRDTYLAGADRLVVPGATNILLSHNPDVFPVAARQGYNLMLAGHTHGGQVTVEILDRSINPARFLTPYVCGLYRSGAAAGYVTRGIGTIGIPVRLGAPPEISVLRLRKA